MFLTWIFKKSLDNSCLENFRCDGNTDNLHSITTLKKVKNNSSFSIPIPRVCKYNLVLVVVIIIYVLMFTYELQPVHFIIGIDYGANVYQDDYRNSLL